MLRRRLISGAAMAAMIPSGPPARAAVTDREENPAAEYTVAGLIALLSAYDPDTPVLIPLDGTMNRAVSGVTPVDVLPACRPTYYHSIGGGAPALIVR